MEPTRRQILAQLVASGLVPLAGCPAPTRQPDRSGSAPDASTPLLDTGSASDTLGFAVSKRPWVQVLGPDVVRLRFESRIPQDCTLRVLGRTLSFQTSTESVTFSVELSSAPDSFLADEAGDYTVHEAIVDGLTPGEQVDWSIETPDEGVVWQGSFRAPPGPGMPCRIGWLSDTMTPFSDGPVLALAAFAPELVLHGGDIQYRSQPSDTWSGASLTFQPLTDAAPMHFAIGNHEFEGSAEESSMFDRLYGGQGAAGQGRYHAFSFGAVRVVMLDSETSGFVDGSPQLEFLDAELAAHDHVIVGFHRPLFTLSKHAPSDLSARKLLHPRFVAHGGVKLVLSGHAHCYERWDVQGVTYVVDGGGGAAIYDPTERTESVELSRPGETALQIVADGSHGATVIDVDAVGGVTVQRVDVDGRLVDEFTRA